MSIDGTADYMKSSPLVFFTELQDTLSLWRCVLTLLQSEEQTIREAATEIVTTAMSQENTCQSTGTLFFTLYHTLLLHNQSWRTYHKVTYNEYFTFCLTI